MSSGIKTTLSAGLAQSFSERLYQGTRRGLAAAGIRLKDEIIHRVPVNTGRLRKSIRLHLNNTDAIVLTDVAYAPHLEYGTSAHSSPIGSADFIESIKDWGKKKGLTDEHIQATIWAIRKHGTKPKPFFRPAFEATKQELIAILRREAIGWR